MSASHLIELPEVLLDFPAAGPVCIEASAGTGKTYTLEHLLLKLIVEEGVAIEKVLVVTFTEKATLELVARLRERLLATREALASSSVRGPELQLAQSRIELALRSYDRACIKTIHGFCQETLADGAMPAGLLLQQQLVAQHTVAREVLLEVVRSRITRDDADGLALRAFLGRHGFEGLLGLHAAVAGERGILTPGWSLEAFRSAIPDDYPTAAEITDWIANKGLPRAGAPVKEGLGSGLAELPEVIDSISSPEIALREDNRWQQWGAVPIGKSIRSKVASKWLFKDSVRQHPLGDRLAGIFSELLRLAPAPAAYLATRLFPEVREIAGARRRALGLLDFDDMLIRLHAALLGEQGDRLRAEVRDRFSWVLIDEFQDTDELQWEIFSELFGKSPDHRVVVVGDPKQAIYGFRGGDLPVYRRARAGIVARNPILTLETSYRSTPGLLRVLGGLFDRGYFEDQEIEAPPLAAGETADTLSRDGEADLPPVALLAVPDDTEGWPLSKGPTAQVQRRALVAELRRLLDPASGIRYRRKGGEARPLRPGDCMVLCLTGSECTAIGQAMAEAGIPHAFFKQEGLRQSPEAEHLRILLRALAEPSDRSARARLWLTPFFELPLARITEARELPETDPLHALPRAWSELAEARRFEALFDAVLVESGLRRRLAARGDERSLTNYLHLCEDLLEGARSEPRSIAELGALLRVDERGGRGPDDSDVRRLETERDAVQILTLHKAKGLEAPVVLLSSALFAKDNRGLNYHHSTSCDLFHPEPGLERHARLPSRYLEQPATEEQAAAIAQEVLHEKQRLFYVAATRARARLVVPAAVPLSCSHPDAGSIVGAPDAPGKGLSFTRGYDTFNTRIAALLEEPELAPLFELLPLADHLEAAGETEPLPDTSARALPTQSPSLPNEALRRSASAPVMTSYSRMKRGTDGLALGGVAAGPGLDDFADTLHASLEHDPVLPGGVRTGLYLHSLLEEAAFPEIGEAKDLATFLETTPLLPRARRLAARHALPAAAVERGLELTYQTLVRPLSLGTTELSRGLWAVDEHRAELPFVYPIPERAHPLLEAAGSMPAATDPLPFRVERGFVNGIIDLVFEHEGKVFFLDWKSDRLSDYSPAALAEHVEAHYALQARLYTLAVTRLHGIGDAQAYAERFGGLAYLYLRGEAPDGLHFERPTWDELVAWEASLLALAEGAVEASG